MESENRRKIARGKYKRATEGKEEWKKVRPREKQIETERETERETDREEGQMADHELKKNLGFEKTFFYLESQKNEKVRNWKKLVQLMALRKTVKAKIRRDTKHRITGS